MSPSASVITSESSTRQVPLLSLRLTSNSAAASSARVYLKPKLILWVLKEELLSLRLRLAEYAAAEEVEEVLALRPVVVGGAATTCFLRR